MTTPRQPMGLSRHDRGGLGAFAALLLAGVAGSVLLAGWAMWTIVDDSQRVNALADLGVLRQGERLEIVHDHSQDQSGSAGCAIVEGDLVRWDAQQITAREAIYAGEVRVLRGIDRAVQLRARSGAVVDCPFPGDEDVTAFYEHLKRRAIAELPEQQAWQPNDPRLREHFGIDAE